MLSTAVTIIAHSLSTINLFCEQDRCLGPVCFFPLLVGSKRSLFGWSRPVGVGFAVTLKQDCPAGSPRGLKVAPEGLKCSPWGPSLSAAAPTSLSCCCCHNPWAPLPAFASCRCPWGRCSVAHGVERAHSQGPRGTRGSCLM